MNTTMRDAPVATAGKSAFPMETRDRPVIHVLVAYFSPAFGVISAPRLMPLEDAVDYARYGFTVIPDPFDLEDLTRYEQILRSQGDRRPDH